MAANLSCQDIDAYANLIGMNSFCKTRWAGNQSQLTPSGMSSPIEDEHMIMTAAEQRAFAAGHAAGQLLALDTQQVSLDQLQLFNQLQVRFPLIFL